MNDETMLIVCVGLCLLMVMLAVEVGFSAALGAFIMGSILAETTQAERIEHLIKSVKNLFAAIFFVSVGMMIDPGVLVEYAGPLLIITLITVFGKCAVHFLGVQSEFGCVFFEKCVDVGGCTRLRSVFCSPFRLFLEK